MRRLAMTIAVVAIGGLGTFALAAEGADESRCPEMVPPQGASQSASLKPASKTVQIAPASGAAAIEMHFGTDRQPETQTQTYFVRGTPVASLRIGLLGDIRNGGTGRALPVRKNQLTFSVHPNSGDPRNANVRVCYDPANPEEAKPGRYEGTLQISAPHVSPQTLPIVVTLSSAQRGWLIAFVFLGAIGAWAARAIADAQRGPADLSFGQFWAALWRVRSLIALVVGIAAGAYAWAKLVDPADSTFDGSFLSALPVLGAAFGATIGTKTVTDLFPPSPAEENAGLAGGKPQTALSPQPDKPKGKAKDSKD